MKTLIIGAGGVGGYFGGKMAHAGLDVTFVARGEHGKMMRESGLHVKSLDGNFVVKNPKVVTSVLDVEKIDLILVCTKAWQIKEVRNDIQKIVHKDSVIIPLQNGILAYDELKETLDESLVMKGLCRIISKIEAPGVINHFGVNPIIIFGEKDGALSSRAKAVKELFDKAGFKSEISNDMDAELWKKFIAICLSGFIAVTKTTYGEMRELPETRQLMKELLDEIFDLSQVMKINVPSNFVSKTISFIDSFPYNTTSSLTRDVWEGKPSELEYQNGTVVKLGQKYGVPTPINRFIYSCILPSELKARGLKKG